MRTLICYLNKNVISIKGAYMYKPRTEWSRPQHPWGPGGGAASAAQGAGGAAPPAPGPRCENHCLESILPKLQSTTQLYEVWIFTLHPE